MANDRELLAHQAELSAARIEALREVRADLDDKIDAEERFVRMSADALATDVSIVGLTHSADAGHYEAGVSA